MTIFQKFLRRYAPAIRKRGSVIRKAASMFGLVYFGSVDQHVDDHEAVRGLTKSISHKDEHYAVGSYDGYDIAMVDRFDLLSDAQGQETAAQWLILEVRLAQPSSLPHLFLQPVHESQQLYARSLSALRHLQVMNSLLGPEHGDEFHRRYQVYSAPTHFMQLDEQFPAAITQGIAIRFWPTAIEVFEGKLYFYTTQPELTQKQIESLIESALWLAQALDEIAD